MTRTDNEAKQGHLLSDDTKQLEIKSQIALNETANAMTVAKGEDYLRNKLVLYAPADDGVITWPIIFGSAEAEEE